MDKTKIWHCILKIFSGRFALTIICGISFLMIVNCLVKILESKADQLTVNDINNIYNMIIIIISNVITFYFTREKPSNESNEKGK